MYCCVERRINDLSIYLSITRTRTWLSRKLLLDVEGQSGLLRAVLDAVAVGDEALLAVLADDVDPVVFLVQHVDNLPMRCYAVI